VWWEKYILTAYFLDKICAKNSRNRTMYVKIIASQRWDVFLRHSVVISVGTNMLTAKATKTRNFICRNVYCCPPDTKATAYISLVRPHLEYAAAAWDPYLVGDCKQLEKVQRRAACFVKRDYRSMTSVSSLISQLGWQTLSNCSRNSHLSLMYKSSRSGWYFHLTFLSFFQAHSFS